VQPEESAMFAKSVKFAILCLTLVGPLLVQNVGYSQAQEFNFKSFNFPDRFIRHRNLLIFLEPHTDALSENDSAFRIVEPGLAGTCHSFESRNFPGFFIRHQNFRLKLHKFSDDDLFRKDSTFCIRTGLADQQGRSFESLNFPNHFMRHQDFEFHIQPNDGSELFKKDATFFVKRAGIPFGDDVQLVPVPN
jgi:hypothetical protein